MGKHKVFFALAVLAAAGSAGLLFEANGGSVWAKEAQKSFFRQTQGQIKSWLYSELAEPLSAEGFKQAPVITFWAGYDFQDQQWKLNEYTNQLGHNLVGALCSGLFGRTSTVCVALGVEVEQYFDADNRQLKLADRIRDILFYLI